MRQPASFARGTSSPRRGRMMGRLSSDLLLRQQGAGRIVRLVVAILAFASTARAADEKTALTVYAEARTLPVIVTLDQAIRTTLQARTASPIHLQNEYLDLSWFGGPKAEELLARLLKEKYAGRKIDLVMPCGEPALRFVLRERATIFPGVPLVFCVVDADAIRDLPLPGDVTGVTMSLNWE